MNRECPGYDTDPHISSLAKLCAALDISLLDIFEKERFTATLGMIVDGSDQ